MFDKADYDLIFEGQPRRGEVGLDELVAKMGYKVMNPEVDISRKIIKHRSLSRPALQLAGYFEYFDYARLQLMGRGENEYIKTLSNERIREIFDQMFSYPIPGIIFSRGYIPIPIFVEEATKADIPILVTEEETSTVITRIIDWLDAKLAPTQSVHGVLVDVYGEGILIVGESGIGKSETAIELIRRGHRIVADDIVEILKIGNEILFGQAPELTRNFVELRGIGIVDIKAMYGVESVKERQQVDMVMCLKPWSKAAEFDRIGFDENYISIMDIEVPAYSVPVAPGRNLAVIIESAAVNNRQKKMGYNAAKTFYDRMMENARKNK